MSSLPARRNINAGLERRGTPRHIVKKVANGVDEAVGRAIVGAAKVEGGAYVAHVGLNYTEALTDQELRAAAMYPERAYRFQAIADGYAATVVNELRQMGYE